MVILSSHRHTIPCCRFLAAILIVLLFGTSFGPLPASAEELPALSINCRTTDFPVMTLLPTQDCRTWPRSGQCPDLNTGVSLAMSADAVMEIGGKTLKRLGCPVTFHPYAGYIPNEPCFRWLEFPLYDLKTDLALAIDIKKLEVKRSGPNALRPGYALLDAGFMPLFVLGSMASDSHFDLAARILPAFMARHAIQVDIHVLSKKAGGYYFTKSYLVHSWEPMVSDRELYRLHFYPSNYDGQEFGIKLAERIIDEAVTGMVQDPELDYLPLLADISCARRLLTESTVPWKAKTRLIEKLAEKVPLPSLTEDQIRRLSLHHPPPDASRQPNYCDVVDASARHRSFALLIEVLTEAAGRIRRTWRYTFPDPDEKGFYQVVEARLAQWGGSQTVDCLYKNMILDSGRDCFQKSVIFKALAANREAFDHETFISERLDYYTGLLSSDRDWLRREAAMMILAANGRGRGNQPVPESIIMEVLDTEDHWAAPIVLGRLKGGHFDAQSIRLAGAMPIKEAWPYLQKALKSVKDENGYLTAAGQRAEVTLLPSSAPTQKAVRPDPVIIVRAMGSFPQAAPILQTVLKDWTYGTDDTLAVETILSLARLRDRRAIPLLVDIFNGNPKTAPPPVRQAVLNALGQIGDEKAFKAILESVTEDCREAAEGMRQAQPIPKDDGEKMADAAEFFGRIRYIPAVRYLREILNLPDNDIQLQSKAMIALGRIANPEAETILKKITDSPWRGVAENARKALDILTVEKAGRKELE